MPRYNSLQQIFSLNWLANVDIGMIDTFDNLQQFASAKIPAVLKDPAIIDLIGEWEVVWGPVIYSRAHEKFAQDNPGKPDPDHRVVDNALYVAAQPIPGGGMRYVAAVSATNSVSLYGWFVEDFKVAVTEDWSYGVWQDPPPGAVVPKISAGTQIGLDVLLSTMKGPCVIGGQQTTAGVLDFLKAAVAEHAEPLSDPLEVAVSGHSLGGALSAGMACALVDMQGVADLWDPNRRAVVCAVPTAGATPGDAVFAAHYDNVLGQRTTRLWNQLDVVPHAWQRDMLQQAPHLYYPYVVPNAWVQALVAAAEVNAALAGVQYRQICDWTPPLQGQVDVPLTVVSLGGIQKALLPLVEARVAKWLEELKLPGGLKIPDAMAQALAKIMVDALLKYAKEGQSLQELVDKIEAEIGKAFKLLPAGMRKIIDEVAGQIPELIQLFLGLAAFLNQLLYQHVPAYSQLLGTTAFTDRMSQIKSAS